MTGTLPTEPLPQLSLLALKITTLSIIIVFVCLMQGQVGGCSHGGQKAALRASSLLSPSHELQGQSSGFRIVQQAHLPTEPSCQASGF